MRIKNCGPDCLGEECACLGRTEIDSIESIKPEFLQAIKSFAQPITVSQEHYDVPNIIHIISNRIFKNTLMRGADTIAAGVKAYSVIEASTYNSEKFLLILDDTLPENDCVVFQRMGDFLQTGVVPREHSVDFSYEWNEESKKTLKEGDKFVLPAIHAQIMKGPYPKILLEGKCVYQYTFLDK